MTPTDLAPVANHLWQSTLLTAAAWLLTLALRKNRAAVRYWIWLAASVQFLIPFSLLAGISSQLEWRSAPAIAQPQFTNVVNQISRPFSPMAVVSTLAAAPSSSQLPIILWTVWLGGFALGLIFWLRSLRQIRAIQRAARPLPPTCPFQTTLPIPVVSSSARLEPGVFGIRRPVLILPEGIIDRLTPAQLETVVAHEMCHVRRRDNLTAAIHMVVELIFWFHPLVWWIRTQLVAERERSCDEELVGMAADPQVYAEAILNVCKLYLESPLVCVSGVTGSNLKKRIEAIMSHRVALRLHLAKKVALAVAGATALAAPIVVGIINAPAIRAQSPRAASKFEVASIKPVLGGPNGPPNSIELNLLMAVAHGSRDGRFSVRSVPLSLLIQFAYNVKDFQILGGPSWANSDRFDVIAKAEGNASWSQMRLMLQSLLADRFQLTLRRETKEVPVYQLAVAKGGLKIETAKEGSCVVFDPNNPPAPLKPTRPPPPLSICGGVRRQVVSAAPERTDRIEAVGVSMPKLIEIVSDEVGRTIVDKTGFTGMFNFQLEFAPEPAGLGIAPVGDPGAAAPSAGLSGPSIFAALQKQLGLRLESAKGPVEVLVIDHVERPSEN